MIIMKRTVFSLSVERTPYQCRYFYIGAWAALGTECCECPVSSALSRGSARLTSRTGRAVALPPLYRRTAGPEFDSSSKKFCLFRALELCLAPGHLNIRIGF